MSAPAVDVVDVADRLGGAVIRTARRRLLSGLVAVGVVAPAVLAVARWPRWWTDIAPEQTPMTWLQSVILVLAGTCAVLVGLLVRISGGDRRAVRPWHVLAAGFAALAFDERFAIHERVRDGILAPNGVRVPFLPWVAPGDFLIMTVGVIGLALLPVVIPALRPDRAAFRALIVGVALAVVAVAFDSIDPASWSVGQERLEQTLEECVELASGLSLLAAVGLRMLGLLGSHRDDRP